MNVEDIEKTILALYNNHNWKDIVNLASIIDNSKQYRFFWILPTLNDLNWITTILKKNKTLGVVSIGCGCGLIEWLLQKYSGLDIMGIELDGSWWRSKYSPALFLESTIFIDEKEGKNFVIPKSYALLFCYFNNGKAFCNYIENYDGDLLLIIGPADGQQRSADPLPFDEKLFKYNWKLLEKRSIMNSTNYITVYGR